MSLQFAASPDSVEPRQRPRSWRWDVVQALHENNRAMSDLELAEATGADVGAIRHAIQGLAIGGVVRAHEVSGDPRVALVCQLAAL